MKKLIIVSILASLAWAQDSTFYEKGKIAAQEDITKIEVSIKRKGFVSGLVFNIYGIGFGYALYQFRKIDVPQPTCRGFKSLLRYYLFMMRKGYNKLTKSD